MLGLMLVLAVLCAGVWLFTHSARFGALPEGAALERVRQSAHYAKGEFHNTLPTPVVLEERNVLAAWLEFLFAQKENTIPPGPVPAVKTPLKALAPDADVLIWLGHSSFFIQLGGKRVLIDPVLSDHAAPVAFSTRAFAGSSPYRAEDFPDIDLLLISHDHWDHLDMAALTALRPRIRQVFCGLGTGAHLRRWGFAAQKVQEGDWGDTLRLDSLTVHLTPARHYSGRSLTRNKTLWAGFALETPQRRLFFSGDSGYGPHFAEIGRRLGPFDLVLLDCGQYNARWGLIHMHPEETAQAAADLRARALLPAHAGRFSIAYHSWDEPYRRITAAARNQSWQLLTPRIGEVVEMAAPAAFPTWWEQFQSDVRGRK